MSLPCPLSAFTSHFPRLIIIADNNRPVSIQHNFARHTNIVMTDFNHDNQAASRDDELTQELLVEIADARKVFEQIHDLQR